MDEYQSCNLSDAPMLARKVKNGENIIFSFSLDRVSSYIMLITGTFTKIGVMPFGGNPVGSYCVSLLYHGFYYFDFDVGDVHKSYIAEKLRLDESAAKDVAEMLNAIGFELRADK